MLKKRFICSYFGRPLGWEDQMVEHFNAQAQFGFDWLIFTDAPVKSRGNVTIVPMTIEQHTERVKEKFGIRPNWHLTERNEASMILNPVSYGYFYKEYLTGYDFWGFTGLDVILGRLDRYVGDKFLEDCDIFGNDPNAVNGAFSLFRNIDVVNNLYLEHAGWIKNLDDKGFRAYDEIQFSEVVRKAHKEGRVRFKSAFWIESDRQPIHNKNGRYVEGVTDDYVPDIHIALKPDGTLINTVTKEEIMMFHFGRTKKWAL